MQAALDRREAESNRVPLDVWIRLNHEDFEEPFDADCVDLSPGGLALRSDFLPEVGDRLSCRFEHPIDGGELALDAEVVWAHDAGERSGQFGLRFSDLDRDAEESVRQLVERLGIEQSSLRLHLDGVGTPIEAKVVNRRAGYISVEQELPFLSIGMGMSVESDEAPFRGRLASVDVRVEGGIPKLILGVRTEIEIDDDDEPIEARKPVTLDPHDRSTVEGLSAGSPPTRDDGSLNAEVDDLLDPTFQDVQLPAALLEPGAVVDVPPRETARVFEVHGADEDSDAAEEAALVDDMIEDMVEEPAQTQDDINADRDASGRARAEAMLGMVRERAASAFKTWLKDAGPRLSAWWAGAVAFFMRAKKAAGPTAKLVLSKASAFGGVVLEKVGPALKSKLTKRKRRRTTATPLRRVAGPRRRRQQVEEEAPPQKRGRRIALMSLLAFCGVAIIVYTVSALSSDEEPTEVVAETAPVFSSPPATAPASPIEMGAPALALRAPTPPAIAGQTDSLAALHPDAPAAALINPETGDVVLPAAETPAAPEVVATGGRLGEPSYPTLRDASERPAGPVSAEQRFGAETVENGRSATITMDNPVARLQGEVRDDGFSVTIPGALAHDRAGPIAAANPSVDRAMILNRGDHSVLTIRFVAGQSPPYQVVARGRAIEVTIGR